MSNKENLIDIEPLDLQKKDWAKENLLLDLVPKDDSILREEMPEFDWLKPIMNPIKLAHTLAQNAIHHRGIGLSAPQIGIRTKAFTMLAETMICCINPKILDVSDEEIYMEEGCLSLPGLIGKVKRPSVIRVRYFEPNTNTVTKKFEGMTARIFQHEMDHLDGILFTDRMTDFHYEQAKKRKRENDKRATK